MRRFSASLLSSSPTLVVTSPSTTVLPLGKARNGSKPPARALSNSMNQPSTAVENMASTTGS